MEKLDNPIRPYAWGSRTSLAQLQGRSAPTAEPEAELWIGAHPGAPSRLGPAGPPLTELIDARPAELLSGEVVDEFGPRLPYLLKVLAAETPLSLQAHPDPVQAAEGFAAEEAAGVPRDDRRRRYVDPYHKPELLVAVTPFRALCGFREPAESAELLAGLAVPRLVPVVEALRRGDLAEAVRAVLSGPSALTDEVVAAAAHRPGYALVGELAHMYPGDPGVVLALLLHEVRLDPGEAIYMPAGNLHAYLHGTGIEIMAASDNVLRGGLTPKHVDVAELLRVLRFEPLADPVTAPEPVADRVVSWPVPVAEFALYRVRLDAAVPRVRLAVPGPRTVLCLAGSVRVDDGVGEVGLGSGEAAFGPARAADAPLVVSADPAADPAGDAVVYLVTVGGRPVGAVGP